MANEISIVIADDHPMFRRGLRQSLEECAEFRILREASDGQAALQMIAIPLIILNDLHPNFPNNKIGYGLLWLSVLLSLKSGFDYCAAYLLKVKAKK